MEKMLDIGHLTTHPEIEKLDQDQTADKAHRSLHDYSSHECTSRKDDAREGKLHGSVEHLGGLNYLGSQEPGELSQAIAKNVVDKFLSDDNTCSSEETSSGEIAVLNSAPTISAKVVQCLVKRTGSSSLAGMATTFDWADIPEKEAGGKFYFNKINVEGTNDQSGSEIFLRQTEAVDNLNDTHENFGVGPSTQMAAEAMEALSCGSTLNFEVGEDAHTASHLLTAGSTNGLKRGIPSSCHSISETDEIMRRFKQRKLSDIRLTEGISSSSAKHFCTSIAKKKLNKQAKVIADNVSSSAHACHGVSTQAKEYSRVVKIGKTHEPTNDTVTKKHSRHGRQCDSKGLNRIDGIDANSYPYCQTLEKENIMKKGLPTSMLMKDSFSHPKRRRTPILTLRNSNVNYNKNNESNLHKNLDVAKWKKRSSLPMSEMPATGSTDSCNNNLLMLTTNQVLCKEVSQPNLVAESLSKAEQVQADPKDEFQCSTITVSTALKEMNGVLPINQAQTLVRTIRKAGLSNSPACRRLARLKTTGATSGLLFDRRSKKDMSRICVLFSQHLDQKTIKRHKKILMRLGIPIATSVSEATHFVADKFARTRNMLEAIAMGKPVVTHTWLESCGLANCFIDEKKYILRDLKKEKEIGFRMPVSLSRACQYPLLQGRSVLITPRVKPSRELLTSLVLAANGQPVGSPRGSAMKDVNVQGEFFIISCEEDYKSCLPFLMKGTKAFDTELILNGIVIQKLEFERHRLFYEASDPA